MHRCLFQKRQSKKTANPPSRHVPAQGAVPRRRRHGLHRGAPALFLGDAQGGAGAARWGGGVCCGMLFLEVLVPRSSKILKKSSRRCFMMLRRSCESRFFFNVWGLFPSYSACFLLPVDMLDVRCHDCLPEVRSWISFIVVEDYV